MPDPVAAFLVVFDELMGCGRGKVEVIFAISKKGLPAGGGQGQFVAFERPGPDRDRGFAEIGQLHGQGIAILTQVGMEFYLALTGKRETLKRNKISVPGIDVPVICFKVPVDLFFPVEKMDFGTVQHGVRLYHLIGPQIGPRLRYRC